MKKRVCSLFLTIVLLLFEFPALAEPPSEYVGFDPIYVNGGMSLPVYSAPDASSWRGANGKAACGTDGAIYAAGREGEWVWIAYYLNHGSNAGGWRVGYVRYSELKGLRNKIEPIKFYYLKATLTVSSYLTDDPLGIESPITDLRAGTELIYLIGYYDYAYVQTTYQGKTVRGFVPDNGGITVHVPYGQYSESYCREHFIRYDIVY